jgi:hypothetical protein
MYEYLTFRKMVTPVIIQVIFWVGVSLCLIFGIVMIVGGALSQTGGGIMVLLGLVYLLLGPIVTRIYCEVVMLFFRIYDTLKEIQNNTARPAQ